VPAPQKRPKRSVEEAGPSVEELGGNYGNYEVYQFAERRFGLAPNKYCDEVASRRAGFFAQNFAIASAGYTLFTASS